MQIVFVIASCVFLQRAIVLGSLLEMASDISGDFLYSCALISVSVTDDMLIISPIVPASAILPRL